MSTNVVALFHPGDMGAAVGACVKARGARVVCALSGRSDATAARARAAGIEDVGSLEAAVKQSGIVLSICPPHGALELARRVAGCGFQGLYVDANAIAPETARQVGRVVEGAGARFVDAGIIGAPPAPGRTTTLALCGPGSQDLARLLDGSPMKARVLEGPIGSASALKACYASWTKGTWLLLGSICAAAEREGVGAALREQWAISHPQLVKQFSAPSGNPAKAWRWAGEMEEIASAFEHAGQPGGFFLAAAEICRRLERFKDDPSRPSIEKILPSLKSPASR
jgi:3-hydroxyisobutyrate dehydrogenase-like beta-hydroxyacid dehydrogenase